MVFMLLQRYKFLSKSQRVIAIDMAMRDVYAIAKVLIFKQITTGGVLGRYGRTMFMLLQRY